MARSTLLWSETRLQTKVFFRTPIAAFFTLVLPLMFLVMINFFLSGETMTGGSASQYITPAIAVFGMVTATFTNLAINTALARDSGVLKRVAGTPMPMSVHLGGRILSAVGIGVLSVAVMLAVGWILFDVEIPWSRLPLFFLLLLIGAATFSALGLAVAASSPSARAAPAIANFVVLPLAFISGIFFPLESAPQWLQTVASWLPLEPLATAAIETFDPAIDISFPTPSIVELVAWGVLGLLIAVRFFSYEPVAGGGGRRAGVSAANGD
ncbi:MAG: ABC transporter permease [Acidimicrobiia bacterium]|jgi:ABC-2 type transport system permease protein